jgi:hypothetical protein
MLLCGVSMAIKQVALVEGAYFGLAFLFLLRRAGQSGPSIAATAILMVVIALAPTAISVASIALAGRGAVDTVIHANFISIFLKASGGLEARSAGFALFIVYSWPLLVFAYFGYRKLRRDQPRSLSRKLLLGWLIAAVGGWIIVPNFFDHYALPLLVPLCVLAAPFLDRTSGRLYFAALAIACSLQGIIFDWSGNRDARIWFARIAATTESARRGGCVFIGDGPTAIYQTVPSCRVTRYLFPHHLVFRTEANAVGVNTLAELKRVLMKRPAVVLTRQSERRNHSVSADALLFGALQRDYRPLLTVPADAPRTLATVRVWQRRDLAPPQQR